MAKLIPLLLKSEIMGKNLGQRFMENKIAASERIVLMRSRSRHSRKQEYVIVNAQRPPVTRRQFKADEKFKIMSQVVMNGYFITRCQSKILLYNADTKEKVSSPDLPSTRSSVEYVGHYRERYTFLSLVIREDDVVEQVWASSGESTTWKLLDTKIKIKSPKRSSICIGNHIYFLSNADKETVNEAGYYEDAVVSFEMLYQHIGLIELPINVITLPTKRLLKLMGGLALVGYSHLRDEKLEIWLFSEIENSWSVLQTCILGDKFGDFCDPLDDLYDVSHATSKGEIVLTPLSLKPEQPEWVFLYDLQRDEITKIYIPGLHIKKNWSIVTAANFIEDAKMVSFLLKRKIASRDVMVLTLSHYSRKQEYLMVKQDDAEEAVMVVNREFEADKKLMILGQVVMNGYFITRCQSKILLYNPDTKQKVPSPDLPSKNRLNSVEYVGKWGDRFTVLSLVTSDEVDESFITHVWAFNSESTAWKLIETDLKIEYPNRTCINIENRIYFLSERCKDTAEDTVDVDGLYLYEDLVVSFEMINGKIELFDLPKDVVSLPTKRLVKLGGLALVAYSNVRENFEIWRFNERDKSWNLLHKCIFGKKIWELYDPMKTHYGVSGVTSNGEIVLTPLSISYSMKPEQPLYVFLYDPETEEIAAIDISRLNIKKNQSILTAVDYIDDA